MCWVVCREENLQHSICRKNVEIKISCYLKKIHKLEHSLKNSCFSFCHRAVKGSQVTSCFTACLKSSGTAFISVSPSYSITFRTQTSPPTLKHTTNLVKHHLTSGFGATGSKSFCEAASETAFNFSIILIAAWLWASLQQWIKWIKILSSQWIKVGPWCCYSAQARTLHAAQ